MALRFDLGNDRQLQAMSHAMNMANYGDVGENIGTGLAEGIKAYQSEVGGMGPLGKAWRQYKQKPKEDGVIPKTFKQWKDSEEGIAKKAELKSVRAANKAKNIKKRELARETRRGKREDFFSGIKSKFKKGPPKESSMIQSIIQKQNDVKISKNEQKELNKFGVKDYSNMPGEMSIDPNDQGPLQKLFPKLFPGKQPDPFEQQLNQAFTGLSQNLGNQSFQPPYTPLTEQQGNDFQSPDPIRQGYFPPPVGLRGRTQI